MLAELVEPALGGGVLLVPHAAQTKETELFSKVHDEQFHFCESESVVSLVLFAESPLAELVEEHGVEEEVVEVEEEEEDEEEVVDDVDEDDVDEDEEDALELEDVDDFNFFWETSSAVGNAASPIPNAPQSTAMICIVLPKPIWSARMQPVLELTC
jgi:hypothetical protein